MSDGKPNTIVSIAPTRVAVLGNSGSGKTYLADALAHLATTHGRPIATLHLDHVHFDTDQPRSADGKLVRRSEADKEVILTAGLHASPHGWIVEGIFGELLELPCRSGCGACRGCRGVACH